MAQAGHSAQHRPDAAALIARQEAGHPLVLRGSLGNVGKHLRKSLQRGEAKHWLRQKFAECRIASQDPSHQFGICVGSCILA